MSIWAIKLSSWIDKDNKKDCEYYRFVKSFIKMKITCSNSLCSNRLHYGMVDLHSAPFGMMDGPFCSWKCYDEGREYERTYKPGRMTLKRMAKFRARVDSYKIEINDDWLNKNWGEENV